ncbi:AAA family ATPase [Actinoplanes solisilvae]|uniref:AAA family ATPase n=1 Tax=Actinoplanes solisilvae TaxID=2486853 RepID=UPI000FD7FC8B|nr:AAA family ATPase [Actinoplanes solisilvae]
MRLQVDHLRQLYEAAREDAERQGRQIAEFERLRRAMDDRDPDEVRDEIDRLRADSTELKRLRLTAPAEKELQLSALEEEARQLRDRCVVYAADNERLQRQLSAHQITATTLERMTVGKEALEAEVRAYRDMIEEEERKWQGLVARREGTSPLPMCTEMDAIHADRPSDLSEDVPPLPELVSRVRALIRQQHDLFYEEADLRSFLAGLATSQLHLLQGISGIGKTQLPQRFAEAIGAGSAVVSVGADWRTPQDLMGYYNAFERRFYESEFTKALYRAQCPTFADQPYVIVLDEMNLSHPEQYFNDVLSALERDVSRTATPDLVLMSAAVSPPPRLLREGRLLPVPRSVFFVGTANHDETTVSFADKTYDRAHVIELPTSPHSFDVPPQDPLPRLSFRALTRTFDTAVAKHGGAAADARTFLTNELASRLADDFRISWGSRLNKHIARYVPVVVAAGGTVGEATDHLIATKVLRKLRGRYEIRVDELKKLRDDLESRWSSLPGSGMPPIRSRSVIEALIRDLGQA